MRILLAVDDSPISNRAARHAAELLKKMPDATLTVLNVDPPLRQAAAVKLGVGASHGYHAENGQFAIRGTRTLLQRLRVPFEERLVIGESAERIAHEAKKGRFDLVVMGSHGRGALKGLLLGSVASNVIALTHVPVTVAR